MSAPDRRVTAPKPERRRSNITGMVAYAVPAGGGRPGPRPAGGAHRTRRELRWVRDRNDWVVEMVVVVAGEDGFAPV